MRCGCGWQIEEGGAGWERKEEEGGVQKEEKGEKTDPLRFRRVSNVVHLSTQANKMLTAPPNSEIPSHSF